MISRIFIDRPIFATVLSIVITLAGGVALFSLPIAQNPPIVPPTIQVNCTYPGASAQVVADSIAAPIEQAVNGVEEMLYMSSNCSNDGSYTLQVTFKPGVDMNFAQVLVQNKLNLALPLLPDVVKQTGVTTRKRSPDILLVITLTSPHGTYDRMYVSSYGVIHLKDELGRIDGVGDVIPFGPQNYSMRIWVDPDRLAGMNLNAGEVVNAVRDQNEQVACGQIGQEPIRPGQQTQITLTTLGRLIEPEQFDNIVIKHTREGRIVRVRDIGHCELGPQNQDVENRLDGHPCANVGVFQLPYANALETADRVRAKMEELSKTFPPDLKYTIVFDTTPYIRESISEVVHTLFAAVILVAIVVLVFLQSWRSALIPLVAVPVAIVGSFAAMAAFGFSLNNLTLFGLVLAIGIVVDDAIVVVEAVEHHIEEGMLPRDAAIQAMREVSGPVIAVALVLTAVFVPCAFISGITGSFFRQFAITVSVSTIISAFNSLTLSPALAAILLKPTNAPKDLPARVLDRTLGWFFRLFNWSFRQGSSFYLRTVGLMLRGSALVLLLYCGLLWITHWGFGQFSSGYVPEQDQGYLLLSLQLPDALAVERTAKVIKQVDAIVAAEPAVAHRITLAGQSFTLGFVSPNAGQFFVILKDYDERRGPGVFERFYGWVRGKPPPASMYYNDVIARLTKKIAAEVPDARAAMFGPPPIHGLGNASGFRVMVEDRGAQGLAALAEHANKLVGAANRPPPPGEKPKLEHVMSPFTVSFPQLYVDVNRDHCEAMKLNLGDVYNTLQDYLGSLYINDFNRFGRTWEVVVQAEAKFRNDPTTVSQLKTRNAAGTMVPMGAVADIKEINGPLVVTRYNLYPAAAVMGRWPADGSSGEAVDAMFKLADAELPKNMAIEWTDITYLQLIAANTGMVIFGLAVLLVFLVLAAQYESWSLPLAIILVVPMCILSALVGVALLSEHLEINIFTQIGFVVLVGLASKNAVLIVEFAKHKRESGLARREATLEACRLRLRPILMTSFAFILGVLPLVVAEGAGAEMRRALGVAVFSGMLGVTFFGILLTPVFFYSIDWLGGLRVLHSPALVWLHDLSLGIPVRRFARRLLRLPDRRPAALPPQLRPGEVRLTADETVKVQSAAALNETVTIGGGAQHAAAENGAAGNGATHQNGATHHVASHSGANANGANGNGANANGANGDGANGNGASRNGANGNGSNHDSDAESVTLYPQTNAPPENSDS